MLFSGIPFLYYFLPCMLIVYFLSPAKCKNIVLLLFSMLFYGWSEPKLLILLMLTVFTGYLAGIFMEKDERHSRMYLIAALLLTLGALGYFKYANFFLENIGAVTGLSLPVLRVALPVGISFYTFQIISYVVDVYRKQVPAQQNFILLATYISMFPQLIAGPIVRYSDIERQLHARTHSIDQIALGIRRFILGLSKKVLLANVLGELCDIFRTSTEQSVVFFWMYAIAFALQIYYDFSGYSDMAIGLGKILGFDFMENFNYPYISRSITEFWRRWHISLGSWFKDYVYIPMGGSRVSRKRMFFNIFIVWMLTGFWHGAAWNFIIWGLFFAVLLMIEKVYLKSYLEKWKVLSHVYVLFAVCISFVIFNGATMGQVAADLSGLFGMGNIPLMSKETAYYLRSYALVYIIAIIGATPVPKQLSSRWKLSPYVEPFALLFLLIVSTAYLVDGSFNPFLYFRF